VTDPNRIRSSFDERSLRLEKIRQQAQMEARTKGAGMNSRAAEVTEKSFPMPHSSVASARTGYYGTPLLKVPAWTWEVPLYFFVGGAAGSAAAIAQIGKITGANEKLINDARWIAALGGAISPALLVSDLGRPERFLNMLRVFKIQSAMSVGSWTLVVFSTAAGAAAASSLLEKQRPMFAPFRWVKNAADFTAMLSGLVLCTYTGVLIGATAVPVWNQNVGLLPMHFATSGLNSAVSILELRGNDAPALTTLGVAAAATETFVGAALELKKNRINKPLHKGRSGLLMRAAGLLSGPIPLILRLLAGRSKSPRSVKLRRAAAISSIAGSVATRIAWVQAGKVSAADPSIPLELPSAPDEKMSIPAKTAIASSS
jgi:hypothetical protein